MVGKVGEGKSPEKKSSGGERVVSAKWRGHLIKAIAAVGKSVAGTIGHIAQRFFGTPAARTLEVSTSPREDPELNRLKTRVQDLEKGCVEAEKRLEIAKTNKRKTYEGKIEKERAEVEKGLQKELKQREQAYNAADEEFKRAVHFYTTTALENSQERRKKEENMRRLGKEKDKIFEETKNWYEGKMAPIESKYREKIEEDLEDQIQQVEKMREELDTARDELREKENPYLF